MDLEQKKQFFGSLRDAQYKGLADPRLVVVLWNKQNLKSQMCILSALYYSKNSV